MANQQSRKAPRSRARLEAAIDAATTEADQAQAHFELALFHDNNSREAEAIPHYERALRLGLPGEQRAECLAWLASSLYKTDRPARALVHLRESRDLSSSHELMGFVQGLERRIKVKIALRRAMRSS